jgi:hypothetical protein
VHTRRVVQKAGGERSGETANASTHFLELLIMSVTKRRPQEHGFQNASLFSLLFAPLSPDARAAPLSAFQKRALATSIIIDTIVGVAVGALLLRHRGRLQVAVVEASQYLVESVLTRGIEWLMSVAPAGLKLNEELDVFMGRTFLSILKVSHRSV